MSDDDDDVEPVEDICSLIVRILSAANCSLCLCRSIFFFFCCMSPEAEAVCSYCCWSGRAQHACGVMISTHAIVVVDNIVRFIVQLIIATGTR